MKRLQRRWARPHDYDLFDVLLALIGLAWLLLWQGRG